MERYKIYRQPDVSGMIRPHTENAPWMSQQTGFLLFVVATPLTIAIQSVLSAGGRMTLQHPFYLHNLSYCIVAFHWDQRHACIQIKIGLVQFTLRQSTYAKYFLSGIFLCTVRTIWDSLILYRTTNGALFQSITACF